MSAGGREVLGQAVLARLLHAASAQLGEICAAQPVRQPVLAGGLHEMLEATRAAALRAQAAQNQTLSRGVQCTMPDTVGRGFGVQTDSDVGGAAAVPHPPFSPVIRP
jgi:hypothetical protein